MAIEEFSFAIHPAEFMAWSRAALWLRDSIEKLGLGGVGLEPMAHAAGWWSTADDLMLAGGAVLQHAGFAARSEDPGWAMALYYLDYEKHPGVVGSVPPWPLERGGRSEVWPWLTEFLTGLVVAADADLCCVNGRGDGDEEERLPSDAEIDRQIPPTVTAWNYLGPRRMTSALRDALRALPAFRSEPLGDGWLLRPVDDYADEPAGDFLEAYARLVGGDAEFLRAPMKRPRSIRTSTRRRKTTPHPKRR